jgi:hypothetical protein
MKKDKKNLNTNITLFIFLIITIYEHFTWFDTAADWFCAPIVFVFQSHQYFYAYKN